MKQLKDLTREDFEKLQESDLLKVIYPDAPDNYDKLFIKAPLLREITEEDILTIINFAKSIVDDKLSGRYHDDNDNGHYALETIMDIVYGKDIWKFLNS